jgi:hypothetical protein
MEREAQKIKTLEELKGRTPERSRVSGSAMSFHSKPDNPSRA